jgi:hypothetical protein
MGNRCVDEVAAVCLLGGAEIGSSEADKPKSPAVECLA